MTSGTRQAQRGRPPRPLPSSSNPLVWQQSQNHGGRGSSPGAHSAGGQAGPWTPRPSQPGAAAAQQPLTEQLRAGVRPEGAQATRAAGRRAGTVGVSGRGCRQCNAASADWLLLRLPRSRTAMMTRASRHPRWCQPSHAGQLGVGNVGPAPRRQIASAIALPPACRTLCNEPCPHVLFAACVFRLFGCRAALITPSARREHQLGRVAALGFAFSLVGEVRIVLITLV